MNINYALINIVCLKWYKTRIERREGERERGKNVDEDASEDHIIANHNTEKINEYYCRIKTIELQVVNSEIKGRIHLFIK